jgi:hypothetical protein
MISEEDVYLPFLTLAYSLELTMEVYIPIPFVRPKTGQTPKSRSQLETKISLIPPPTFKAQSRTH